MKSRALPCSLDSSYLVKHDPASERYIRSVHGVPAEASFLGFVIYSSRTKALFASKTDFASQFTFDHKNNTLWSEFPAEAKIFHSHESAVFHAYDFFDADLLVLRLFRDVPTCRRFWLTPSYL